MSKVFGSQLSSTPICLIINPVFKDLTDVSYVCWECRNNLIHIQPELLLELHYLLEVCKL